ncbi:MAG: hypothetical protein ACXWJW_07635 [Xanthobacteraceae bacterium]
MVQFDPSTGLLSLPIWISATVAAVLVVLTILAMARSGTFKTLFTLLIFGLVGYGGWMGWLMFERVSNNERVEEKRAFERRVADVMGRASAPGSVLSCLEGGANEALTAGCERVVFGNPENVAAVLSYTLARVGLLTDGLDLAARSDANYDSTLNLLRRGLELDRFGVVAYVLAQQPECLPTQCEMLALFKDANRLRVNLQDKPFEALVAKYSPQWTQVARTSAIEPSRNGTGTPPLAPPAPVSSRYDLPSAASIPPVSIMNTEQGQSGQAAAPAASAPAASPVARPRPPAARPPAARSAAPAENATPPVPLAPSAAATPPAVPNPPARP